MPYRYKNGKYQRLASNGTWFNVNRNNDGYLYWKLPDGSIRTEENFRVPDKLLESNGVYTVGTGIGSQGHYFNFYDAINAYNRAINNGAYKDPSENTANDLVFGVLTGKAAVDTGKLIVRTATSQAGKQAIRTATKDMAIAEGADLALKLVTGRSVGDITSLKLQEVGVPSLLADIIRPEYYISPLSRGFGAIVDNVSNRFTPQGFLIGDYAYKPDLSKAYSSVVPVTPIKRTRIKYDSSKLPSDLQIPALTKRLDNFSSQAEANWFIKNYDAGKRGRLVRTADLRRFDALYLVFKTGSNEAKAAAKEATQRANPVIKSGVEDFPDWNIDTWFSDSPRVIPATESEKLIFKNHVNDEYLLLTKDLIDKGDLVKRGNVWYGNVNGKMTLITGHEQEYVVSRSKAYEANWANPGFEFMSGILPTRIAKMTTDNHSATYLNNNPLVYQHYRDWTPQGTRSYNGKLIHYSPPKDVLAQAEVIRGNPGSTSNNFFGVESILETFNKTHKPAMFFKDYFDIASRLPAGTTLIFSRGVPVKSIKGNTGDFDLNKGMFSYNHSNDFTNDFNNPDNLA